MQTSRRRSPATSASTAASMSSGAVFVGCPTDRIRGKGFELLAGPSMLHDETMDRLELYYRLSIYLAGSTDLDGWLYLSAAVRPAVSP